MSVMNHLISQTSDAMNEFELFFKKISKISLICYIVIQILQGMACKYVLSVFAKVGRTDIWGIISIVIYMELTPIGVLALSITSFAIAKYFNRKKFEVLAKSDKF